MKKILIATIIFLSMTSNVFAVTSTPSAKTILSPTPKEPQSTSSSIINKSIELLKQRIATSVAKIEKSVSKLNIGHITKKDKSVIEIKTKESKVFKVTLDPTITKVYTFSGSAKKEIKAEDLEMNDYVIISGPPLENSITANNIYRDVEYIVSSGKVTEVNATDFTIKVITVDKDNYTLNIENSTKQQLLDIKTNTLNATGFSKIKVGDTIHFVAQKPSDIQKMEVSTDKIIVIPQEYFMK